MVGVTGLMATITKRKNLRGDVVWSVLFRRKGFKSLCRSFCTKEEALKFAQREAQYIYDYKAFIKTLNDPLEDRRNREFRSKGGCYVEENL